MASYLPTTPQTINCAFAVFAGFLRGCGWRCGNSIAAAAVAGAIILVTDSSGIILVDRCGEGSLDAVSEYF